jgi:cytochrome b561
MSFKDTSLGYGRVSRALHWVMALAIFGLFGLGWWMVDLTYYSPYYKSAPDLHRSVGVVVFLLLVLRFGWRMINQKPSGDDLTAFEKRASSLVHWSFYPLLLVVSVSGYLISTPDGRPIEIFGLFSIPSLIQAKGLEDTAGYVHWALAYAVIALALVHTTAALKHHFSGHSRSLTRMWSGGE